MTSGGTSRDRKSRSDAILESKMAASGFRKTVKYCQIPCNMGILGMGVTSRDRKLMSDAILESKGYFRNGGDF